MHTRTTALQLTRNVGTVGYGAYALPKAVLYIFMLMTLSILFCSSLHAAEAPKGAPGGAMAPLVTVMTIEAKDIPLPLEYSAQTAGSREVEVRARVGGILEERTYVEGSMVRKGQKLFQIDPSTYKAALDQAKGELAQTQARFHQSKVTSERIVRLYAEQVVSRQERDDAVAGFEASKADMEAATAKVADAQINLDWTSVTAPISGLTSKETVSEGNLIDMSREGSLLTTIVQTDPLYVNFAMPGTEFLKLRKMIEAGKLTVPVNNGFVASLTLSDGTAFPHKGVITFMDSQEDPSTASVRARASFPNPDNALYPGQFVRITLHGTVIHNAIAVPQSAVLTTQQGTICFTLDEKNNAVLKPVVVAGNLGNFAIIEKGLEKGDRLVVEGILKVKPGSPVIVAPDTPDPSGTPDTPATPVKKK